MVIENRLLASLPTTDLQALQQEMRVVRLSRLSVLCNPDDQLTRAYFPHDVAICKGILDGAGQMASPAIIGSNGMIGAFATLDGSPQGTRAFVQSGGNASTISIETLRRMAHAHPAIGSMLRSYCRYLYIMAQQVAACNASHSLTQRLCTFLIQLQSLTRNHMIEVTQEQLGEWLAVRRTSVCLIAHQMQRRGVITIKRGKIEITDPKEVSRSCCDCDGIMNSYYGSLFHKDNTVNGTSFAAESGPYSAAG